MIRFVRIVAAVLSPPVPRGPRIERVAVGNRCEAPMRDDEVLGVADGHLAWETAGLESLG